MEISPLNSEHNSEHNSGHNSESEYFEKGTDSDFEKALLYNFKDEITKGKKLSELKEKIYEENLDNMNNEPNNDEIKDNFFIEIKKNEEVQIKAEIKKEMFKINKIEAYTVFIPAKNMEYYKKYKNLNFNTWKDEKSRKEAADNIRKKIKSRFFKSLKNCINQEIEKKGINKKMEYLPQNFISNISKEEIKLMLDKTLKEIINIYCIERNDEKSEKNLNLLKYLEVQKEKNNDKINKIYKIFQTKIKNLFNEYIHSEEFEQSLVKLKEEGNYFDYIKSYINEANNFINFFSN